jgi:hypothetical protein
MTNLVNIGYTNYFVGIDLEGDDLLFREFSCFLEQYFIDDSISRNDSAFDFTMYV